MSRSRFAAAVLGLLIAGCGGGGASAPPEVLYGQDICDLCRMVISERRHAAGARRDGRAYRFDDPGCLRGFLAGQDPAPATAWVHDENEVWQPVENAWFVEDPEGGTPMASGILAYSGREAAAAAGEAYDAEPRRWARLPGAPLGLDEGRRRRRQAAGE